MSDQVRGAREKMVQGAFYDAELGMVCIPAPLIDAYAAAVRAATLDAVRERVEEARRQVRAMPYAEVDEGYNYAIDDALATITAMKEGK